jgi:predicted DNA binding CopG/RHH family protein
MTKLDREEQEILESFEAGEWTSVGPTENDRERYSGYARATFKKDRRINIRLSTPDLEALQKRAVEEGIPYQTLVASILHKYVQGRLREAS